MRGSYHHGKDPKSPSATVVMSRPRISPWLTAAITDLRKATQQPTVTLVIVLTKWRYLRRALRRPFWLQVLYPYSLDLTTSHFHLTTRTLALGDKIQGRFYSCIIILAYTTALRLVKSLRIRHVMILGGFPEARRRASREISRFVLWLQHEGRLCTQYVFHTDRRLWSHDKKGDCI
jgi:hypothetical protein